MTKFQTAQENPYSLNNPVDHASWCPSAPRRGYFEFDPSVIFALHEEPVTDVTELIACSSGSPEDILIALEELAQELYLDPEDTRYSLEQMAPTTTNIQDKDNGSSCS